jgi:Fur family transcriptional regulator, ferric uptake regulator
MMLNVAERTGNAEVAKDNGNDYRLPMKQLTAQRQAILDLINTSNRHWDAEEVGRALSDRGQAVGIATVYRGLTALDEAGLISSVQLADRKRYERADKSHHDHMVCTECGKIEEFSQQKIETLQEAAAREKGFEMSGHQLILFGRCAKCATASR